MFEPLFTWLGPLGATVSLLAVLGCVLFVVASETLALARPPGAAGSWGQLTRRLREGSPLWAKLSEPARAVARFSSPGLGRCRLLRALR